MRILVGPPLTGHTVYGFAWTTPGEPLLLPNGESCGNPACGCGTCFVGAVSRKGTTLAVVGEWPGSRLDLERAFAASQSAAWRTPEAEAAEYGRAEAARVIKAVGRRKVGTQIDTRKKGRGTR